MEKLVITFTGRLSEPGEIARSLRQMADAVAERHSLESLASPLPLRDSNGNTIGEVTRS